MKTQNEILTDIYKIIKDSPINDLNGGIYKRIRPTSSTLEDCVISLINGTAAKFLQDGNLIVKIFFDDINSNNSYFLNDLKSQAVETLLFNLSNTLLNTNGYSFEVQSREIYTEPIEDENIHQHYSVLRINFKITI